MHLGKWAALLALAGLAGGCATVTRGTTNQVTFDSVPQGAEVHTSAGHSCPSTPCTVEVNRKAEFTANFSKPGYQEIQIPVATRVAGSGAAGFAGNLLVGGIVGMGVDAATGSTLEHFPNPVIAELQPLAKPGPIARRRTQKPRRASAPAT